jgi:NAD(P)-dependent dehydrogenase (short-subunit alcohol dehydrogenase family)
MDTLSGKTALITGGSDGIGLAIADAFAREGADLVLLARNPRNLATAADALRAHRHGVRTLSVDLTDPRALDATRLPEEVDILVNNAGVAHFAPLPDIQRADFDTMVRVNLAVPFELSHRLLPALTAARGAIINISSYWATKMVPGRPSSIYSATRGALNSLTRALASELGPAGIRVNAIAPGAVHTPTYQRRHLDPMTPDQRRAHRDHVRQAYPAGRIGDPADVAAAALYLASSGAWVTGTILTVDGGLTIR